jgi:hypothetical protein
MAVAWKVPATPEVLRGPDRGSVHRATLLQQSGDHAPLGGSFSLQTLGNRIVSAEDQMQLQLQSDSNGDNQWVRLGLEKKFDH